MEILTIIEKYGLLKAFQRLLPQQQDNVILGLRRHLAKCAKVGCEIDGDFVRETISDASVNKFYWKENERDNQETDYSAEVKFGSSLDGIIKMGGANI